MEPIAIAYNHPNSQTMNKSVTSTSFTSCLTLLPVTHPFRFNSLLFKLDFLITGNFPLKKISIYEHLLLTCFSIFLSFFFIVRRNRIILSILSKAIIHKTRRMESISHCLKFVSFLCQFLFLS